MRSVVGEGWVIFFDAFLILFEKVFKVMNEIFGHSHLTDVYFGLFTCKIFLVDFLAQFIECSKVFLNKFLVFLILEAFVGGQGRMSVQIGVTNLVDDIFAGSIERCTKFVFQQIEISINSLLEDSTFRLYATIHCVFPYKSQNLFLIQKHGCPHVIVILLQAVLTSCCFFPNAALRCAKHSYFLPVLTLVHYSSIILCNGTELSQSPYKTHS